MYFESMRKGLCQSENNNYNNNKQHWNYFKGNTWISERRNWALNLLNFPKRPNNWTWSELQTVTLFKTLATVETHSIPTPNSLLSVIVASTRLLLTTWLNSWESISLLANFADLLILPFSVFPLYAHTRLVKGHFLMLRRQSGTLSLTKSGHATPSHFSVYHCGVKVCKSIYIH